MSPSGHDGNVRLHVLSDLHLERGHPEVADSRPGHGDRIPGGLGYAHHKINEGTLVVAGGPTATRLIKIGQPVDLMAPLTMRSMTSASQASGSSPLSLAVSSTV